MKNLLVFLILLCVSGANVFAQAPTKPLAQMEVAFIGNPSQSEIKTLLDRAMKAYDLNINDENYSRAGSTLVTLRKDQGVTEMDILKYMIKSHVDGVKMDFPKAAALSAVFLKAESGN